MALWLFIYYTWCIVEWLWMACGCFIMFSLLIRRYWSDPFRRSRRQDVKYGNPIRQCRGFNSNSMFPSLQSCCYYFCLLNKDLRRLEITICLIPRLLLAYSCSFMVISDSHIAKKKDFDFYHNWDLWSKGAHGNECFGCHGNPCVSLPCSQ